jgi:Tfp pilus assembly protein PilX
MLNERGMALPLVLLVVMILGGLGVGMLAVGGMEPQISRNLSDTARARALADSGVEWAFNGLVATANWGALLAGATCASGVTPAGWPNNAPLPGAAAASGTYTVTVRNDCLPTDNTLTGAAVEDAGNVATDTNGILILTSRGTVNGAVRSVQVVVRRDLLPSLPGAINLPGVQADTSVGNINPGYPTLNVAIDGRDYNRDGTLGSGPMKTAIATQTGNQQTSSCTPGTTSYQQKARNGFDTTAKRASLMGKNSSGTYTTGLNTVLADAALNQTLINNFLAEVKANPATTVLNSTLACPLVMTGTAAGSAAVNNGCGLNQNLSLGTPSDPKLVYFTGDLDPTSQFAGLTSQGTIQGAGILIIEDGDFRINDNFRWDGLVIVTGRYVGMGLMNGSNATIYGAVVSMETQCNESSGFNEFLEGGVASSTIRVSQQNFSMAQTARGLHRMYSVREL